MKPDLTRALYALAQRPCGVTSVEAIAAHPDLFPPSKCNCAAMLGSMAKSNRLKSKPVREGKVKSRYFADASVPWSDVEQRIRAKVKEHQAALAAANKSRKPPPVKLTPATEVIVPAHVKVTVGPCHPVDARYQCEPGERVWGCGFAALKPGQYIAEAHGLAARAVE